MDLSITAYYIFTRSIYVYIYIFIQTRSLSKQWPGILLNLGHYSRIEFRTGVKLMIHRYRYTIATSCNNIAMHDARSATFVKQGLSNCPCTFVSKQQPQVQVDSTNLQHNFKFRMSQPNQCFNSDRKISCNVVSYIKPKSIRPHSCPNSEDHASLWTHFFRSLPIGQIFFEAIQMSLVYLSICYFQA